MARGGSRPGAGRRKGTPNKASVARQKRVAATGITPLEYMLGVMRDAKADTSRRDDMAKACAPYVHPKLASMQHTGANGGPIQTVDLSKLNVDQLRALESALVPLALAAGDGPGEGEGGDTAAGS